MEPFEYGYGEAVRVTRTVRNDGSYPGVARGERLVRRGSIGYVRDRGTFLQDQAIYAVHFPELGRVVGCRDSELQAADAPWVEIRFEPRDRVRSLARLAVAGEVVVEQGLEGEVLGVQHPHATDTRYQVLFPGPRVLLVPERCLETSDAHAT